ncbi:MAG: nucleotidyltransferase family protein [Crocinitomicaceae bacterium]
MKPDIIISASSTLMDALKQMDAQGRKLLVVLENEIFQGVLSIGDLQRAILSQKPLETKISEVLRTIITVAHPSESKEAIKAKMLELRSEAMPVVDDRKKLVEIIHWEDVFGTTKKAEENSMNLPVVIMAGGKGTRLRPLTNVIPKPLIPVGEKTMLETIVESFTQYGCDTFHLSVNYKAELIRYYLENNPVENAKFTYFEEPKPLGTAGSLSLLKDQIQDTFFVTNCDILVEQDYTQIYKYHKENNNELTVVGALKHIDIPYGTLEAGENGILKEITEKPSLTYLINSGLYILEPHLIAEIPNDEFYHITHLIGKLMQEKRRVGVFPVSEKSWKDIGEWKEYMKFIDLKV